MAKSIPGPWTAKGYQVFALEEHPLRIIAYARGLNIKERTPEDEANARLIAAAPDLLEACEDFVEMAETPYKDTRLLVQRAKAAIQKAKGAK
jgi:hypothetical protein